MHKVFESSNRLNDILSYLRSTQNHYFLSIPAVGQFTVRGLCWHLFSNELTSPINNEEKSFFQLILKQINDFLLNNIIKNIIISLKLTIYQNCSQQNKINIK